MTKKLFSLLLVFALLLGTAWATGGDPNLEGGGGETGAGTGTNRWFSGNDGIRVSVIHGTTAIRTFDLANRDWSDTIERCFTKKDKLTYKRTQVTTISMNYNNHAVPDDLQLPTIVPGSGGSNIGSIRGYFTDRRVIEYIADKAGMDYDILTSGEYKLLLEPIIYLEFSGKWWAMTATEAALYDVDLSGGLHSKMGSLTRQNLPLSMFLERSDLGITAWVSAPSEKAGATSGRQSNIDIINYLGVGIVSFPPGEDLDVEVELTDYTYRTDTDVITSVLIHNTLGRDMDPDTMDYVTFNIAGTSYSKQIICPAGKHQLVWVKWHTPRTPQEMTITVRTPGFFGTIIPLTVSIVDLEEKTPPDPGYDGPGEGPGITGTKYRPGFTPPAAPNWGNNLSSTWTEWIAQRKRYWEPNMEWVPTDPANPSVGAWEDHGEWIYYWDFAVATYAASLSVDFELVPDSRVPTAVRRAGKYVIGSGYGVDAVCKVRVSGPSTSDVTKVQNVVAVFPEFDYETYDRLLEPERNAYSTTWGFKSNPYSYYGEPVHFTPLWFPDGPYAVSVAVFDVWTPGGMLYASVKDSVTIDGDMYDDWYIRVIKGG